MSEASAPEAKPAKKRKRWRRLAIDLGVIAAIFIGISLWQSRGLVSSGEAAPDFVAVDLDGVEHRLADLKGRKVLLFLWAPWCGVCKVVAPNVASIAKGADDEKLVVLSVAFAFNDRAQVEKVAREAKIPSPVLLGPAAFEEDYGVSAYPTIYMIDEEGRIRHAVVGYTTWLGLKIRSLI